MEWGTPVWWGWFLLFSRSVGHKTKKTYPTRPGSPTPCKQGLKYVTMEARVKARQCELKLDIVVRITYM